METTLTTSPAFSRFRDGLPVGDVIPFYIDGTHHLFILTPPPGTVHFPERLHTTWRHVVSHDLRTWEELAPAIQPGAKDDVDGGGIWTGSATIADGVWHIFYTGHGADQLQAVCHATSEDGVTWVKDPRNPISKPDADRFETKDWRDPFVFWNDEDQVWWMLVTARSVLTNAPSRGVIALATSQDLETWSEFEVLYDTFLTHAPECPEIFELDGRWVLGYSRFTDRRGTVYRVADSPRGPWRTYGAEQPDAANWYAAKGLSDSDGRRFAYGWVPDHDESLTYPANPWLWGGDLALPRELRVSPSGAVTMHLPPEVREGFGELLPFTARTSDDTWRAAGAGFVADAPGALAVSVVECQSPRESYVLRARFDSLDDVHQVGVIVHTSEMIDRGVGVFYYPRIQSIRAVDMTAPQGKVSAEYETMFGQYAPVAEHDLATVPAGAVDFTVVVRGDVVEAFVGEECCLTYRSKGTALPFAALVAVDGSATVTELEWRSFE